MDLTQRLKLDMGVAMKLGEKARLSAIRMLLSEIQYGLRAKKPLAADLCALAYKKKLEEALPLSTSPRREELEYEIKIVSGYCPVLPTEEELRGFIQTLDLTTPLGTLIKEVRGSYPLADGKLVTSLIQVAKNEALAS